MKYDICIIGGGASGMAAAVTAAVSCKVLIIEKMDKPGRKILATGNGRCNLSNKKIIRTNYKLNSDYHSSQNDFPQKVMASFDSKDAVVFFRKLGLMTTSREEYIYPASMQAAAVRNSLAWAIENNKNITLEANKSVKKVKCLKGQDYKFQIITDKGEIFYSRKLILAAGGKSSSKLGSDGSGYELAKSLGHTIIPVVPALCALKCQEKFFKKLAGVRVQARVSLIINGKISATDRGEVQLANYGISGIPVFQVSRFASYALSENKKVAAELDLMPEHKKEEIITFIEETAAHHKDFTMSMVLSGIMNSSLAELISETDNKKNSSKASSYTRQELDRIANRIKAFSCTVTASNDFEQSQVSAGGVSTKEIDPETMESKRVPGLHFAGEIMDVDGICGGYNLQFAWSTGVIAGRNAGKKE